MSAGTLRDIVLLSNRKRDKFMRTIKLNGEVASSQDLTLLAKALSTPTIVREKGGYLFKSRMDPQAFHFGILPNFLNGQRTYHYDIDIGPSEFNLIGSINASGSLTAVFKPARTKSGHVLLEANSGEYRRQYGELARFLIECGLPSSFPLDSISTDVLRETQLCGECAITIDLLATW